MVPKSLSEARVAIVGLGLMGGSLGLALRERHACREVVGIARRPETVELALRMGAVDRATTDLAAGVADADIVVLATPVRTILRQIPMLGSLLSPPCVVLDMGSTKSTICRALAALPDGLQPIGGHPMCGKETTGIEVAEATLYQGKTFVLTPLPRTGLQAVALAASLATTAGSRVIFLEPERHDRLVAAISHLPYLLSSALVAAAEEVGQADKAVWDVAASGFRDTSRLAASDVTMMLDILLTNREAVLAMVEALQGQLGSLADCLRREDEASLRALLEGARARRSRM
ncbi:MAG: prephenate dehydrogenase [Anaerolineae bacterium]|nr:prephenate dehydrogenase [Anaerolineae bacterium]